MMMNISKDELIVHFGNLSCTALHDVSYEIASMPSFKMLKKQFQVILVVDAENNKNNN